MKKILTILTSLGLTTTAITSVISCQSKTLHGPTVVKTDLNDLHLVATVPGVEAMTDTNAFAAFIQANPSVPDLRENVSFGDFKKPEYKDNGSLTINAKPNTKYSGSMTVTITAIGQQVLSDLFDIVNAVPSNTTKDKALQTFLDLNKSKYPDLRGNVTLDDDSFIEPTYVTTGSYIINATSNGKYSGSMTVTITAIGQQALAELGLNLDLDSTYDNEQTAFDAFIQANANVTDLKENVTHSDFVPSSYGTPGSLKISATSNGKYSGFVTLNTKGLTQIDFSGWNKQSIHFPSVQDATQEETYNWFMLNNPEQDFTDFENYITFNFKEPTSNSAGSLTISAKPKTKYSGEITITVAIDNRPVLNELNLITEVENTTTEDIALTRFLSANNNRYPDLQGNVHLEPDSFLSSTPQTIGSFIVTANSDGKYQGSVKVIIPTQNKIALDTVITNKHISGVNTTDIVIQKVLDANPNSGVTESDLKLSQVNYEIEGLLGTATVEAQSSSKFSGTVLIDFAIMPDDDRLTTISNNIKNSQSNEDFIRSWGEYFGYYNDERLQYIIDTLNRPYRVNVGDSPDRQKQDLQNQIFGEFNYWFLKIVEKDGLSGPSVKFRNYEMNKVDIIAFDATKKIIQFNLELHFSWNLNEGGTIGYNVGRTVTFHFGTYTN